MNTLIHADIFFFITACSVVIISIIFAVFLVYAVMVAKNIHYVVTKIKEESDNISADIAQARMKIREQGTKIASLMAFFKNMVSFRSAKVAKDYVKNSKKNSTGSKRANESNREKSEEGSGESSGS